MLTFMEIGIYGSLVVASLVVVVGQFVTNQIPLLTKYTLPPPVVGGLLVALTLLMAWTIFGIEVNFDRSLQAPLMLAFFATIGLSANLGNLKAGGPMLVRFLIIVVALLILQNAVGIGIAHLLSVDPMIGLLSGSITLSGGHGTGAAWSKVFTERYGIDSAAEVAIACATFGLIMGGVLGGPIARYLMQRVVDTQGKRAPHSIDDSHNDRRPSSPGDLIRTIALIALSVAGGETFANLLSDTALELPVFVCVLFVGTLIGNVLPVVGRGVDTTSVSLLGNVSLALFLAFALMTLRLWDLASLAAPVLLILAGQTLLMASFAIFVTFRLMGRNHDAAVLASGHCGFGLGATPTAIANMQAVTARFGPSPVAFLVVPMVGAFFIDIANAIVIKAYLSLPIFSMP